jgi:hypothetical protein
MVCTCVVTLLHESVAVHVLVITDEPAHVPAAVVSAKVTVATLHISFAVNIGVVGIASQETVASAGKASTKDGGVVS